MLELQEEWRRRLGRVRKGSAVALLLGALPATPMLTVQSAAALIGRSQQATNEAIARLVESRILKQTTAGNRNRAFEAPELINSFTALDRQLASHGLERQLASPDADTRLSPPVRTVPYRPS